MRQGGNRINWSKVSAAEVREKGQRLGSIAGPLDEFTIWRYQDHTVMICEAGDKFSPLGPHICAVLQGERIVWLDPLASAGAAILLAALAVETLDRAWREFWRGVAEGGARREN